MYHMYHDEMVSFRLSKTTLDRLDRQRGGTPRGRYIRHLVEQALAEPVPDIPLVTKRNPVVPTQAPVTESGLPQLYAEETTGRAHKWKKYPDAEKCERCGVRRAYADPTCRG